MRRTFAADQRGASAVEFAFVAPILILIVVFVLQLGIAVQRWTALQAISDAVARCVALSSATCSPSSSAQSYAVQLASDRGVPGLSAAAVSVGGATVGGVAMVTVTIQYPYSVAGMNLTLNAAGSFPAP